jgi:hypothetical protein
MEAAERMEARDVVEPSSAARWTAGRHGSASWRTNSRHGPVTRWTAGGRGRAHHRWGSTDLGISRLLLCFVLVGD